MRLLSTMQEGRVVNDRDCLCVVALHGATEAATHEKNTDPPLIMIVTGDLSMKGLAKLTRNHYRT